MQLVRPCLVCGLLILLSTPASPASAQATVGSFADVPNVLETGRKVVVTSQDGEKTKGRVVEITPASITLMVRDSWGLERRQSFPSTSIRAINKTDSVWNGLLIGLGAGIAAGEVFVHKVCGPRGSDDECTAIATGVELVAFIPGGIVIGGLIDKFTGNKTLYEANAERAALSIAPMVGRSSGGVALSLRF